MHFEVGDAWTLGMETRKPYPTDVSDEECTFGAPYLTLMTPDAPQRDYSLREVFNASRDGSPQYLLSASAGPLVSARIVPSGRPARHGSVAPGTPWVTSARSARESPRCARSARHPAWLGVRVPVCAMRSTR